MDEVLFALTLIFVVAARTSLSVVPFYLLAGVLAGVFIDEAQLLDLAQWGIAFIVFLFGIRFDVGSLRATGRISGGVALLQAGIVGGLGVAAGLAFGFDPVNAVYLGVAAALSSSLVAVSYLDDARGPRPTYARIAESVHFTEDILGVLVVVALGAFVYVEGPGLAQFAIAAGLLALALAIRYLLFHRLTARLEGDDEVMMLIGVSFVVGFIALAEYAGLSVVVGAFAAGIAVADDYPLSLELVDTVDDLEDFFTPIFFVTVGALVTVPGLQTLGYTLLLVGAVAVINPLVVAFVLLRGGFDGRTAVRAGLTLDQMSVFTLFIAIEALAAGTIYRPLFDAIVLAAVVTLFVAAYTARHAEAINRWVREVGLITLLGEPLSDRSQVAGDLSGHVIVVDFERGSRRILETAAELERPVLVIEDDPTMYETLREACDNYVFGDVLDDRVWDLARLEEAALVVSLTPESDRAVGVVDLDGDVPRVVRVDDEATARKFLERGATGVLYPDALAGERLAEDLEALLSGELSEEEFTERARAEFGTE